MTTDERERAYHGAVALTPEREAAWSRWKDDYLANCIDRWIEQGGTRPDLIKAATVVIYDLRVIDDEPWMPLGYALAERMGAELLGDGELEEKARYINALRTVTTSTRHERTLATAYQLGITVQQATTLADSVPSAYEAEAASTARTALYRHYDDAGSLLYVGIAKEPGKRGEQHRYHSKWHRFVADTRIEWHETRELASAAERQAIADEGPIFNQTHNKANRAAAVEYLFGALEATSPTTTARQDESA